MHKRILVFGVVSCLFLSACANTVPKKIKKSDVKDPFSVEYSGEQRLDSVSEETGEVLYTPEYVLVYRFEGDEEKDIQKTEQKLKKSSDKVMKKYGKSVMGTTYDAAVEIISNKGQDFGEYRVSSSETLENLAQLTFTNDSYLFNFCGAKLEDDVDSGNVTIYYTMKKIVGNAYEEGS